MRLYFVLRAAVAALLVSAVLPAASRAQSLAASAAAGASFETYEFLSPRVFGTERISLASLPFGARGRPLQQLQLEVRGAFARGSLSRADGSTATISGLTDTELRATWELPGGIASVTAGYMLPTGHATQTLDEIEVAGLIASDLIPFRVSNWGSGGGMGVSGAVAVPAGAFAVGVSAGYTAGRSFTPLADDEWSYLPGSELRVRAAVDRTLGRATKAALVLDLQRYGDDEIDGERAYRAGNRMQAMSSLTFAAGWRASGVAYLGVLHRGAGRFAIESLETPAMDIIMAGTGLRIPAGAAVVLPVIDVRVLRRTDGLGQGLLTGVGASAELPLAGAVLIPTLRARVGRSSMWEGADSSIRGMEIGLTLRAGVAR
jgi:hypothetical protein